MCSLNNYQFYKHPNERNTYLMPVYNWRVFIIRVLFIVGRIMQHLVFSRIVIFAILCSPTLFIELPWWSSVSTVPGRPHPYTNDQAPQSKLFVTHNLSVQTIPWWWTKGSWWILCVSVIYTQNQVARLRSCGQRRVL